jgi:hypothetical protein
VEPVGVKKTRQTKNKNNSGSGTEGRINTKSKTVFLATNAKRWRGDHAKIRSGRDPNQSDHGQPKRCGLDGGTSAVQNPYRGRLRRSADRTPLIFA